MEPINIDNITFHQLQICITVMEYGSFTDAANALFVSQPSISKQVANLERTLGMKLFVRGKNMAVTPTPAGEMLILQWQNLLSTFYHSATEAAELQRRKNRVISLSMTPSMKKELFLGSIVHDFLLKYPDTAPHINLRSPQNGINGLFVGTTDIILIHAPYQKDITARERIQSDWLIQLPLSVGMLKTNPLSKKKRINWIDLKDMEFVLPNSPLFIRLIDNYCTQAGFRPQIGYLCRFFSAVSSNICHDNEVFFTSRYMSDYMLEGYSYFDIPDSTGCGILMHTRKGEQDEQVLYMKELLTKWFQNNT